MALDNLWLDVLVTGDILVAGKAPLHLAEAHKWGKCTGCRGHYQGDVLELPYQGKGAFLQ